MRENQLFYLCHKFLDTKRRHFKKIQDYDAEFYRGNKILNNDLVICLSEYGGMIISPSVCVGVCVCV